jgi:hypothetical protein
MQNMQRRDIPQGFSNLNAEDVAKIDNRLLFYPPLIYSPFTVFTCLSVYSLLRHYNMKSFTTAIVAIVVAIAISANMATAKPSLIFRRSMIKQQH